MCGIGQHSAVKPLRDQSSWVYSRPAYLPISKSPEFAIAAFEVLEKHGTDIVKPWLAFCSILNIDMDARYTPLRSLKHRTMRK